MRIESTNYDLTVCTDELSPIGCTAVFRPDGESSRLRVLVLNLAF